VVNTKEALKWYKIGADKGIDASAADIAQLYRYGYEVKKDLIEEKNGWKHL
jgi:TPR repeat protein